MYITDEFYKFKRSGSADAHDNTYMSIRTQLEPQQVSSSKILGKSKYQISKIHAKDQNQSSKPIMTDNEVTILPKLKEKLNTNTNLEIQLITSQNNNLKKELDTIIYNNKISARKLK